MPPAKAHTHPQHFIKLSDCWAKTDRETGEPKLSVEWHCLIVGVIAGALYCASSSIVQRRLPLGFQLLVALHDIGKITPGFLLKAGGWKHYEKLCSLISRDRLCTNHALMSLWHLSRHSHFKENSDAKRWLLSTGGHHGKYIKSYPNKIQCWEDDFDQTFASLRDELIESLSDHFGPLPTESAENEDARIHLLTGFTIFSDWIGSNNNWFPLNQAQNLETLRNHAEDVLEKLLWEVSPKENLSFGAQFKPENPKGFQPLSIQSTLLEAAQSPGLYIVEAPMGMGKTEAALSAAYQLWNKKAARGLYFALPTQLTSEKIHERIHKFLKNTIGATTLQTLIHGNAWLDEDKNRCLVQTETNQKEEANNWEESLRWYSSTRRQMLAPFGTGTIDQALLAVLPAKFAALRCFALAGKVVVIDEVHSFDPYMSALIDRLIHYLIETGSTVIILSATLTAERRRQLVEAAGAKEPESLEAYPLITKVASGEDHAQHFEVAYELPEKTVQIKKRYLLENQDHYWQEIADKVESGANVVVIRNTVALAQETYNTIKSCLHDRLSSDDIGLIHSRFPHSQRLENETKWTKRLGNDNAQRPKGSLLVSTQILEQSVDIDADLLITDLAPIDLILQRIGRLHRHERPQRPTGCEQATCEILLPDTNWKGSAKEIRATLLPHSFIYQPITLWRAAKTLENIDSIFLPSDIRSLLESNGALTPDVENESGLQDFLNDSLKDIHTKIHKVKGRDIFKTSANDDAEGIETRDGIQPTAQLILLKASPVEHGNTITMELHHGGQIELKNHEFSLPLAKALQLNATRIPRYLVAAQLAESPAWLRRHNDDAVLAIYTGDSEALQFNGGTSSGYQIRYRMDLGVSYRKEENQAEFITNEYDHWN